MVVVGTTIFTAVLGFNLLGEGFRRRLDLTTIRQRGIVARAREKINFWLDQNVWYPLSTFFRKPAVRTAVAGALVLVIGIAAGSWLWPQIKPELSGTSPEARQVPAQAPGDANGQLVDAEANQSALGESVSAAVDWEFVDESGFSGGPALSPQNNFLYIASDRGKLYALSLDGKVIWQTQLPAGSVGTPTVAENGDIFISDDRAGLTAVSQECKLLWHFQSDAGSRSVSAPTLGSDGRIFFTVTTGSIGFVQAVSPAGESLWAAEAKTPSFFEAPRFSPDEKLVFLKDDVFEAPSGKLLQLNIPFRIDEFIIGEDGHLYLRSDNNVIQWRYGAGGFEILQTASWNANQASASHVFGAYVDEDSVIWLFYRDLIAWLKPDGTVIATRQSYSAVDALAYHEVKNDQVITTECIRQASAATLKCAAYTSDSRVPFWESAVDGVPKFGINEASWVSGDFYVASGDTLYKFFVGEPPK